MMYLVTVNWGWLLAAGLVGLGMGWIAVVRHGPGLSPTVLRRIIILIAALLVLALARLLPGRFGYGLDLALVMLGVYLAGCLIGSWLRYQVVIHGAASG